MFAWCCKESNLEEAIIDPRCVVYYIAGTTAISEEHAIVGVEYHEPGTERHCSAFAQLCPYSQSSWPIDTHAATRTVLISYGLKVALQLRDDLLTADTSFPQLLLISDLQLTTWDGNHEPDTTLILPQNKFLHCRCKGGTVQSVDLYVSALSPNCKSIARSFNRVSAKLLHGILVWEGKRHEINWFDKRYRIDLLNIKWKEMGSGCSSNAGHIDAHTSIISVYYSWRLNNFPGDTIKQSFPTSNIPTTTEDQIDSISVQISGYQTEAKKIVDVVRSHFRQTHSSCNHSSAGCIITGIRGVGKTKLAMAVAVGMKLPFTFIRGADCVHGDFENLQAKFLAKLEAAHRHSCGALVVIDALHHIASQKTSTSRLLKILLAFLDRIKNGRNVYVIATASRLDEIDPSINRNNRLNYVLRLEVPTKVQRLEILTSVTHGWRIEESQNGQKDLLALVSERTSGYVAADLVKLCQMALLHALEIIHNTRDLPLYRVYKGRTLIRKSDLEHSLKNTCPSILQGYQVYQSDDRNIIADRSTFDSFYGLEDAIFKLRTSILEPLVDCDRYLRFGTLPPKGVLLTGPTGSGKTQLALAVASECEERGLATFISVKCTELINKVIGSTEQSLQALFRAARQAAPSVIFFDQIECLAPVRGFDSSTEQTFDRLLSMLLVEMDGFSTTTKSRTGHEFLRQHVVVLASADSKKQLDPAILRPGRFDVQIELKLPDQDARRGIVSKLLTHTPIDYIPEHSDFNNASNLAQYVAENSQSSTAVDIAQVFQEAALTTLRSNIESVHVTIKSITTILDRMSIKHRLCTRRQVKSSVLALRRDTLTTNP